MKTLTPDEQCNEVNDWVIQTFEVSCQVGKCIGARVATSFNFESRADFVNRLLDEGWQVKGKRKLLVCPTCAQKEGLNPIGQPEKQ